MVSLFSPTQIMAHANRKSGATTSTKGNFKKLSFISILFAFIPLMLIIAL